MPLKFLFDECADEDLVAPLRAHGVDVKTITELGWKGLHDPELLRYAFDERRVIYTIDHDFLRLAKECHERGIPFAGIVFHRPEERSKGEVIQALLLMRSVYETEDMNNRIEFISLSTTPR